MRTPHARTPRIARSGGFTLIELVVAMALAAVAAAIALPSLAALIERDRNTEALHRLTVSLALARISAIRQGRPVSVCPSRDGRHCLQEGLWSGGWLVFSDPRRRGEPAVPSAIIEAFEGTGGGLRVSTTPGRSRVTYDALGWSAGSNATFRVCSADGLMLGKVVVNNAGRTRMERPRTATACPG